MPYKLSDLMLGALLRCGSDFFESMILTSGSTTTFVNTLLEDDDDDQYNGAMLIVSKTTDGLAPQGEFTRITDYASTSHTGTIDALTAALGAGDVVIIVVDTINKNNLISLANSALLDVGTIQLRDESITSVSGQTEYALPAGINLRTPIRVYMQTDKVTVGDEAWQLQNGWNIQRGASPKLQLGFLPDVGYKIAIEYFGFHPALAVYSDTINENVPTPLAELILASKLFHFVGVVNDNMNAANSILADLDNARKLFPIEKAPRVNKLLTWRK